MSYTSINEKMEGFRILIWNASDVPAIRPRMEKYNYTEEKFNEGKSLWKTTDSLVKQYVTEMNEQKAATREFNENRDVAEKKLKRAKKLARLAFEDNSDAFDMLNLKVLDISTFEDWIIDAERFYTNLLGNPEWLKAMENLGYTKDQLTKDQEEVTRLRTLQKTQQSEMGDPQQITHEKKDTFSELKKWCHRLSEIAKIEFEDEPQYLEKLGILARS